MSKRDVAVLLSLLLLSSCFLAGCGVKEDGPKGQAIEKWIAFLDALAAATDADELSWTEMCVRSRYSPSDAAYKSYLPDGSRIVVGFYGATRHAQWVEWFDEKDRVIEGCDLYEADRGDDEVEREKRGKVNASARRLGEAIAGKAFRHSVEGATTMLLNLAGRAEKDS